MHSWLLSVLPAAFWKPSLNYTHPRVPRAAPVPAARGPLEQRGPVPRHRRLVAGRLPAS